MVEHLADTHILHEIKFARQLRRGLAGLWIIAVQFENKNGIFALALAIARPKVELIYWNRANAAINNRRICRVDLRQVERHFTGQPVMGADDENRLSLGQ